MSTKRVVFYTGKSKRLPILVHGKGRASLLQSRIKTEGLLDCRLAVSCQWDMNVEKTYVILQCTETFLPDVDF